MEKQAKHCLVLLLFSLTALYLSYQISGFSSWSSAGSLPLGTSFVMSLVQQPRVLGIQPPPVQATPSAVRPAISRPAPAESLRGDKPARPQTVRWNPASGHLGGESPLLLRPSLSLSHVQPQARQPSPASGSAPPGVTMLAQAPLAYSFTLSATR